MKAIRNIFNPATLLIGAIILTITAITVITILTGNGKYLLI